MRDPAAAGEKDLTLAAMTFRREENASGGRVSE